MLTKDEIVDWTLEQIQLAGYFDPAVVRNTLGRSLHERSVAAIAYFKALPACERHEIADRFAALGGNQDGLPEGLKWCD